MRLEPKRSPKKQVARNKRETPPNWAAGGKKYTFVCRRSYLGGKTELSGMRSWRENLAGGSASVAGNTSAPLLTCLRPLRPDTLQCNRLNCRSQDCKYLPRLFHQPGRRKHEPVHKRRLQQNTFAAAPINVSASAETPLNRKRAPLRRRNRPVT